MLIGLIPWLVLKTGLSSRAVTIGVVIVGLLALAGTSFLAWNLWLSGHDKEVVEDHEAGISATLSNRARTADQTLNERAEAARAAEAQAREEFDNATAHIPKSGLTDRQRVDACRQLRAQGEDQTVLARARCL